MAGLLWSKQYYHYDVEKWISTSDDIAPLSDQRKHGRNHEWLHLKNQDIILMPDKWEYPWYAAWDLAFHAISMAMIDPVICKASAHLNHAGMVYETRWAVTGL